MSRAWGWRGWLAWLAAVLIGFHTLIAFGLPPAVPILGTALLAVLFRLVGGANGLSIAVALALGTLAYGGALALLDWEQAVYYRPQERLAAYDHRHDHKAYAPRRHLEMDVRHGDLQSMTDAPIAEPHRVVFRTDGRGFRNDADYAGERYLLVGDSFVAGMNNTQSDILGAQLRARHGVAAYHLAFPGDVDDYLAYLAGFRADHGQAGDALVFLFEGNDFPARGEYEPRSAEPAVRRLYKRWFGLFSDTGVYRFTASAYKRWRNRRKISRGEYLLMDPVAGERIAFYRPYVDVSRAPDHEADAAFTERLRALLRLSHRVYFVPTKYRVHHGLLDAAEQALPDARWRYLAGICAEVGAQCADLSAALTAAAGRQASHGERIWWRDDTHWNARGIAAAADEVAGTLADTPPTDPGRD